MIDTNHEVFHVYNRGNNGTNVFETEADITAFFNTMKDSLTKFEVSFHHYVIMTNHYHIILSTLIDDLAKIMRYIDLRYSYYYKFRYGHRGHLWQHRYGRKPIGDVEYLLYCGAYIELNPVRGHIVSRPEDYCWSSYRHYAYGEPNSLLSPLAEYESLSRHEQERQETYRDFTYSWV